MSGKPRGDHALSGAERSAAVRARKKARDRLRDEALAHVLTAATLEEAREIVVKWRGNIS